jgi:hypothetical protein
VSRSIKNKAEALRGRAIYREKGGKILAGKRVRSQWTKIYLPYLPVYFRPVPFHGTKSLELRSNNQSALSGHIKSDAKRDA